MTDMQCRYEPNAAAADVFVVPDVLQVPETILWNAVLGGGLLLTFPAFVNQGGAAMQYVSALAVRRFVHMSSQFQQQRPDLADIVLARMEHQRPCAWKLLPGLPDFLRRLQLHRGSVRGDSELVALVAEAEQKPLEATLTTQLDCKGKLGCKVLTSTSAVRFLQKIKLKKQGLCGK